MRVFVLGIDGLTHRILTPLMARGLLPNFRRLKEEGAWGTLQSTVPPVTPPAWSSIVTGLKPAQHGVFDLWDFHKDAKGCYLTWCVRRKAGKAIWELLSEQGKRVIVVNVPTTFPPDPVNGTMLSGFGTPSIDSEFVHPPSFRRTLLGLLPEYRLDVDEAALYRRDRRALRVIGRSLAQRQRLLEYLIEHETWDFFFFVLTETDRLQHYYWDRIVGLDSDVIPHYGELDRMVGLCLETLCSEDLFVVLSDHGFHGANKAFQINRYLTQTGFLSMSCRSALTETLRSLLRDASDTVRNEKVHSLVNRLKCGLSKSRVGFGTSIDMSRSRFLAQSGDGYASVFALSSRADTQSLTAQIQDDLGAMVEVIGGGEETFGEGAFLELAPDLVLMASDGWTCKRDLGWGPLLQASNRGVHEAAGAIFLHGGNIKQGAELHSASVYDVVPTLLYALGLPIRSDLTGKVLHEAFRTEREVRVQDARTGAIYSATHWRSPTVSEKIRTLTEL